MLTIGTSHDDEFYFGHVGEENEVRARAGNDTIDESGDWRAISDDAFYGGIGNDVITSRSGNDMIFGGAGDDIVNIYASSANVIARGGRGYDIAYIHLPTGSPHTMDASAGALHLDLRGFEEIVYL